MQIKSAEFKISAASSKQYPDGDFPEVVLVGKSNVGKSSFINTLTNRKALARTSNTPGKTRQINFYFINSSFYFVDLPGYGFSQMSKMEQEKVGKLIESYLICRKNITLILFLLDIRHDPTKDDVLMYQFLNDNQFPFAILANKADKIAPTKIPLYLDNIKNKLKIDDDIVILPFSSEKKIFTDDVLNLLDESRIKIIINL